MRPLPCLGLAISLAAPSVAFSSEFLIDQVGYAGGAVAIAFTDSRLATNAGLSYAVEVAASLSPPIPWTNVYGATFSSLGGLRRMATLPAATPTGFYRMGTDADADGLSDAMELRLGTDPDIPDSDGDGFSDAIELRYGTNPGNFSSRPPNSVLPSVSFTTDLVTRNESDGTYNVPLNFSAPYFGTIRYTIATNSSALPTTDYQPLSGEVQVGGTSAVIPVQFVDDLLIRDTRVLHLTLKDDLNGLYRRGAIITHSILLEDNDGYWNGVLKDMYTYTNSTSGLTTNGVGFGELGFRLKLLRQGATSHAALVSTNDPNSRVRGVGTIPLGEWPMQTFLLGAASLNAASAPIQMPGTPLFPASLDRTFTFTAQSNNFQFAYDFKPNRIIGDFTETLSPWDGSSQHLHLQRTNRGLFILLKDLPQQP